MRPVRPHAALAGVVLAGGLTLVAPVTAASAPASPTVTSVTPNRGSAPGGLRIAVKGSGFTAASTVHFGATPTAQTTVINSTLIYARTPALTGTVDVRVTTVAGTSASTTTDRYTVVDVPDFPVAETHLGVRAIKQACARDGFCMIVGENGTAARMQDGVRAGVVAFPADFVATDVSCASASMCAAIDGFRAVGWNGSTWSAPTSLGSDYARTVSCAAARCVALSARQWWSFDGSAWTGPMPGPDATHIGDGARAAGADVSCPTSTRCLATVAYRFAVHRTDYNTAGSFYLLAGDTWTRIDRAHYSLGGIRPNITCASVTYCLGATSGVAQRWDGSSWTPSDYDAGADPQCFAPGRCIGTERAGTPFAQRLVEIRPGRTVVGAQLPTAYGLADPLLACSSATRCLSTNYLGAAHVWTPAEGFGPAIALSGAAYAPADVSCVAAPFCVTVNHAGRASTWTDSTGLTDAVRIDPAGAPTAVSCTPSSVCTVVDDSGHAIEYRGTSWRPPTRIDDARLTDVSCVSADFCVAVDSAGRVVRHEDGVWHLPTPRIPAGPLRSVSCTSTASCLAVGNGYAVRYFGSGSWGKAVRVGADSSLVSCASATSCDVIVDDTSLRTFGGQAFSPTLPLAQKEPYGSLSCADEASCILTSAALAPPAIGFTMVVLDGSAHRRNWGYPWGIYSPVHAVSCWAREHCMFVGRGDTADVS